MDFDHVTLGQRVLFGAGGAVANVRKATDELGVTRALLLAGGSADALADEVTRAVPVTDRIRDIQQHVPVDTVRDAVAVAENLDADVVIAVGGGSAVGLAKLVARDTGLPVVAVPTTFAGSEATNIWGQTENGRKVTGTDDRVLPKVIVYDASLSATLPVGLATASGLNAIAHAVDSLWAPRADPINAALGTEGLRTLIPSLRRLHARPDDLDARERTLYGAYLAAVAFGSAGSGMHHKICHVLGGAYDLSHAEMHAIVLPYVTAFNAQAAPDAADRVASALGVRDPGAGLYALRRELGTADSLAELGLREQDIPEAARLAAAAIPPSNPRSFTVEDVEAIIRAAWAGTPLVEEDVS